MTFSFIFYYFYHLLYYTYLVPCSFNRCNNQTLISNYSSSVPIDQRFTTSTAAVSLTTPTTMTMETTTLNSTASILTFNFIIGIISNYLISGSNDTSVKLWYLNNGSLKATFAGHTKAVTCVLNARRGIIVSGSADHSVKIWYMHNSSLLFEFNNTNGGHTDQVSSLVSINYYLIASASWDKTVKVWDLNSYSLKFSFDNTSGGHTGKVNCLSLLNSGLLASGSSDNSIKVWDAINGGLIFTFDSTNGGYSKSIMQLLGFSNDMLVANANDTLLKVWSLNSTDNNLIDTLNSSIDSNNGYFTAIEATDNLFLVAGLSYGGIKVWDPSTGYLLHTLDGTYSYNSSIDLLCAIPSGLFAVANGLNEIRVYDAYYGTENFNLAGHAHKITSMIVADNGDLISGSLDGSIRVWSMATRLAKYVFNNQNGGHTGSITALAKM